MKSYKLPKLSGIFILIQFQDLRMMEKQKKNMVDVFFYLNNDALKCLIACRYMLKLRFAFYINSHGKAFGDEC